MARGKVGHDLADAILAPPNNTYRFAEVPTPASGSERGPTLDGIGQYLRDVIEEVGRAGRPMSPAHYARSRADVLVSYLPVGSRAGHELVCRAGAGGGLRLRQLHPRLHRLDPGWAERFAARGLPLIGDDIKSQVGATIVHRVLANLFRERGVRLDRTYQLNFGGNTDFLNMLERERLESEEAVEDAAR